MAKSVAAIVGATNKEDGYLSGNGYMVTWAFGHIIQFSMPEDYRFTGKESGIGTPATRTAIIETLFARDYIRRDKKSFVPTEKGLSVYETVRDKRIADSALTGGWEYALSKIESGGMPPETFSKTIETYTRQITTELLDTKIAVADSNIAP